MSRMLEDFWSWPFRWFAPPGRFMLPRGRGLVPPGYREPSIDIVETDKEIIATAEMPGLNKEDIKINITENRLEISAEMKREEERTERGYTYRERRRGAYYRSIVLPTPVDSENSKATYNNGVLEIRMPKKEVKERKLLPVE